MQKQLLSKLIFLVCCDSKTNNCIFKLKYFNFFEIFIDIVHFLSIRIDIILNMVINVYSAVKKLEI